jgi:fructose-1,6-bisphosphatase/inositol monophosphatase family enzyme
VGVVLDPVRRELFTAVLGQGAYLNGERLRVSTIETLEHSLLVTGFAYNIRETTDNNLDHFSRISLRAQGVRRTGSAALDLSYVAAGRFDGYWEVKLSPWDMAAGNCDSPGGRGSRVRIQQGPIFIVRTGTCRHQRAHSRALASRHQSAPRSSLISIDSSRRSRAMHRRPRKHHAAGRPMYSAIFDAVSCRSHMSD